MAAPTELYVDPSIAGDSGAGTSGDPYGDLEYCMEQEDWDATNGIRVNIKAGTDEILAVELSTAMADVAAPGKSVAWTPAFGSPLIIQGYTSAAGDGGIGGISGNGSVAIINDATKDYIYFIDMHLHNTGATTMLTLDDYNLFINCEFNNCTASNIVTLSQHNTFHGCYIHDCSGQTSVGTGNTSVMFCVFENGPTNKFTKALQRVQYAYRNIFILDGSSDGLWVSGGMAINNSIYSNGGTGQGIVAEQYVDTKPIINNLIEGFSGAGGVGIDVNAGATVYAINGANTVYDCTTEFDTGYDFLAYDMGAANETGTASPFTDVSLKVVDAQDETSYSGTLRYDGSFAGGASHSISDVITVTGGTTATVDNVSAGAVTEFTISNSSDTGNHFAGTTLSQTGTTGSGTGFSITLGPNNRIANFAPVDTDSVKEGSEPADFGEGAV